MLHPDMEPYVALSRNHPAAHPATVSAVARREAYHQSAVAIHGELAPVAERRDLTLDLPGRSLAARLYVPAGDEHRGVVVFFHGGSFVVGDLDTHENVCRRLAVDTGLRFLAVDYRLAPEHPFPAGVNDASDSLRYVAEHLADFADEGASLIVMGDSAGATLATVAAREVRGEVALAAQVLIYPTLGPEIVTDSVHTFGHGYLLDMDDLRYDYGQYLGGFTDHTDPRVTPLMATDLTGVAPAIVVVAECDPLRDEGVAYAGLLEHFGVPVELLEAEGMVHGFIRMGALVPEALAIVDDVAEHLHGFLDAAR